MTCDEVTRLVGAYHDGELDAARADELEGHVAACVGCAARLSALRTLSATLRSAPYYRAPAAVIRTAQPAPVASAAPRRPRIASVTPWLVAALASVVAIVALLKPIRLTQTADETTAEAVLSSHVRSLMADHLVDVASSDRHTVKPWFAGRVDFSPTVVDLATDGFPLAGGRLDYIDGRPVAALVYRRRQHVINVFLWPSTSATEPVTRRDDPRGYHLVHWGHGHMTWWVVSDVASADLNDFADRLRIATANGS